MTNKKSTKRALLLSALSLLMCVSMLIGSTFAWFTDSVTSVGNQIISGKLDVDLVDAAGNSLGNETLEFVDQNGNVLSNILWEPGCTYTLEPVRVKNNGNLWLKYEIVISGIEGDAKLLEAIEWTIMLGDNEVTLNDLNGYLEPEKTSEALQIIGHMKEEAGNEYQEKSIDGISITVYATQYTKESDSFDDQYDATADADTWDGTADTSWYNDTDTEFIITSTEELAGFAILVDNGNTFAGKTVKLGANLNLYAENADGTRVSFEPIGDASNADFSGTFDGNSKTIFNLYQDCNSNHLGLFGAVYEGTVKNLTLDGARVENNGNGYASGIAAYTGASIFENITLKNSTVVNYNHNTGGIVGWCSNNGTTTTFDRINIESSTTIGSWWGSYDTRVGGVVGAMNTGNNVVIKNSTIACQLDVYNDVTSNYQWGNYRMAGMVVGDVRDTQTISGRTEAYPARVTCENVEVIFGDWANYHYCESASYGTPSYADEGKYKYNRVEAGLGYGGVDLSACNHAADETHNELITFDCLFGARDGKGIYSINAFNGVTVSHGN